MPCNEYQEEASQYLDGELVDEKVESLFKHLGTCVECRHFLHSVLELRSRIHDEMLRDAPTDAARQRTTGFPVRKAKIHLSLPVAIAAIVLIVISTAFATMAVNWEKRIGSESREVTYVMSLPTIEVQGLYPATNEGERP